MMSFRDDAPSGWGWAADQGDSTGELIERLSTEFAPLVNTDAVIAIGRIFPSDFAIDGLLRVNQMGADLREVWQDWRGLWLMVLVYFILAGLSVLQLRRRPVNG